MVGKEGFFFARILGSKSRQSELFSLFYYNNFRSSTVFRYSTTAKAAAEVSNYGTEKHFFVDYLKNSLNFSKNEAISAAAKVNHFNKSQTKPALVVDYLKQIGMEPTHIKTIASKFPKLLFYDPDKSIHPKIQCLQELGLSSSDLFNFIVRDAFFLARGLETHVKPTIDFLKQVAGSNQNALKAIKRSGWWLSYGRLKYLEANVQLLRNLGVPDKRIQCFVMKRPCFLTCKSDWIVKIFNRVETDFGISRSSPMFYSGLFAASELSGSIVDKKHEILRSFGWSKTEISTMVQKQPRCLTVSEAKLKAVLNFLMNELGYGSGYLACRPMLLMSSLENKTIPRSRVLKTLEEHQLRVCSLSTALYLTESKFYANYLLPYKDKLPDMHQRYITSIGKLSMQ